MELDKILSPAQKSLKVKALINMLKVNKHKMSEKEFQQQRELMRYIVTLTLDDLKALIAQLVLKRQEILGKKREEVEEAQADVEDIEQQLVMMASKDKKQPKVPPKKAEKKPEKKVSLEQINQIIEEKSAIIPVEIHL